MKEFRGIYARWNCFLSSFDFSIIHRAGKKQINADSLSRRPGLPEEAMFKDPNEYLADIDTDIYAIQPIDISPISKTELHRSYESDPTFSRLLPYLHNGLKPDKNDRKMFLIKI